VLNVGTAVAVDYSQTIQDNSEDVFDLQGLDLEDLEDIDDANLTSRPNVDIIETSFSQDGSEVTAKLILIDGGTIQYSDEISLDGIFFYMLNIYTTHHSYTALYGFDIYGLTDESSGGFASKVTVDDTFEEVDADINLVDNREINFKFNLLDKNERCLKIESQAHEIKIESLDFAQGGDIEWYIDVSPELQDIVEYFVSSGGEGGDYNGTVSDTVSLSGDIDEADPSDLEWYWVFNDQDLVLEGKDVTHSFEFPGTYSGTLIVFDELGNFGQADFQVEISGENDQNPSDLKDKPEEENTNLILFAALIIIVVIAGLGALIYIIRK
jgi:hypothetical protein